MAAAASDQDIRNEEKVQQTAALGAGGVVVDSNDLYEKKEPYLEPSESVSDISPSTTHNGETGVGEDELPRDLEALSTVPSNRPPFTVFTPGQRKFIVFMASCGGFFSAASANIYFPALNALSADFHESSTLINLTLTTYMIMQGLAPTFIGDMADMLGRRPAYITCFVIYIGANIGLALCQNYASLLVLRMVQAAGSSATIALGSGVVADIATSAERGNWMGWVTAGPMVAPALAPVLGGILAQFAGWRWIFWFLTILAASYLVPFIIVFPETGRNVVGNGSVPPQKWNVSLLSYLSTRRAAKKNGLTRTISRESKRAERDRLARNRKLHFPNPINTLRVIAEKDVGLLLFFNSVVYTAFYDITSSTPYLFAQIYGFNDLQVGLCFIPFGIGCFIAPVAFGKLLDWNFRRVAKQAGMPIDRKRATDLKDFPLEKARVQVTWPLVLVGDACLLCYGWVLECNANLAAPLVLQFIMGLTLTGAFNCNGVMLVDLYPLSPSTATAANNLVRCFLGAGGTALIVIMIDRMGRGWCFTFIALVVLACMPILFVLQKWGPGWREERRVRLEAQREKKAKAEEVREKERMAAFEQADGVTSDDFSSDGTNSNVANSNVDYTLTNERMRVMLLEQQEKKRVLLARLEQKNANTGLGGSTAPEESPLASAEKQT